MASRTITRRRAKRQRPLGRRIRKKSTKINLAAYRAERAQLGEMWLDLSVQAIATDRHLREAIKRYLRTWQPWEGPRMRRASFAVGKTSVARALNKPVRATIKIEAYLTSNVPKRLRERVYTIRSEGEAVARAAEMYLRVYQENERLGGEPAIVTEADIRKRIARRRRRARKSAYVLVNRFDRSNEYVWGHDLCDLVFEQIHIKWTGKRACEITFGIGS